MQQARRARGDVFPFQLATSFFVRKRIRLCRTHRRRGVSTRAVPASRGLVGIRRPWSPEGLGLMWSCRSSREDEIWPCLADHPAVPPLARERKDTPQLHKPSQLHSPLANKNYKKLWPILESLLVANPALPGALVNPEGARPKKDLKDCG